ncbi:MAG: peptidylprolyl isomerase [Bacteroidetes bacterium]|nr:peptidylprolyl isomerase [Bacteroidota bacterium]
MQISPNKVISISYRLTLDNGELADEATAEHPLMFIHGIGQTLEAFDDKLHGLETGAEFQFSLTPDEGYGTSSPEMVIDISRSIFNGPEVPKDLLELGNMVPMQDQDGRPMNGIVLAVDDQNVRMDFNHPLADQNLHFTGTIISIREATDEEKDHGHVHGPGGHHHH